MKVIITCEHGGNKIPKKYSYLFRNNKNILATHEGFDLGALELAGGIFKKAGDYFYYSETSRLLVELNRSVTNKNLFSKFTKKLNQNQKDELLKEYYFPYRNKVENRIRELILQGNKIMHLSVHSFTPVINYKERNADIGLLFDPKRKKEKNFASLFRNEFSSFEDSLKIRFNYPYLGISDGLTSYLRKEFKEEEYIGIELEINQKYILSDKNKWKDLRKNIIYVLSSLITKTSF